MLKLTEAYEGVHDVQKAKESHELNMIRNMIDNLNGYVEYLVGIREESPNTRHESLAEFRAYLQKHIGSAQIGEWADNKYRAKYKNL